MKYVVYSVSDHEPLNKTGYYFQNVCGRILSKTPHAHDFFEIIYVYNGFCVQYINGDDIDCTMSDIFFLRPGDVHFFKSQSPDVLLVSISVSKSEMEKYISVFPTLRQLIESDEKIIETKANLAEGQGINSYYLHAVTSAHSSVHNEFINVMLASLIQSLVTNKLSGTEKYDRTYKKSDFDYALMQMSSPENIKGGIDAMVRITNYSHSHLCRVFRERYNITPHDYISNLRMNYAFSLVAFSTEPLEKISEKVGYASYSQFNKKFKQTYNKTLSQVRKENHTLTV